jgi:predicted glycosyltransferase
VRLWADLANSPHVPLLIPIIERVRDDGHDVVLTVRDHAQTLELARGSGLEFEVIGGASPDGRIGKARGIGARALSLRRFARHARPDVAFSHGSYAQVVGARLAGVPAVTMMDYEFQPANHLSFRLAQRVIVPEAFDARELRRAGGRDRKVVRYHGFKEQLYLAGHTPDPAVLDALGLDASRPVVVLRPAPEGALYHRMENDRFDRVLATALATPGAQAVVLPRRAEQGERYRSEFPAARVPATAVDAASLVALADVVVGAGGTMTREAAILGTPTYTVFAGRLAGVDAELMRQGRIHDLRDPNTVPVIARRQDGSAAPVEAGTILDAVVGTLYAAAAKT